MQHRSSQTDATCKIQTEHNQPLAGVQVLLVEDEFKDRSPSGDRYYVLHSRGCRK